jgi:hypothetical protein
MDIWHGNDDGDAPDYRRHGDEHNAEPPARRGRPRVIRRLPRKPYLIWVNPHPTPSLIYPLGSPDAA